MIGDYYGGHMFGWGLGGGVMMILFWVALIIFIVWIAKEVNSRNQSNTTHSKSAIDVLKERYAKGEVDKKEFEEKKRDLE